MKLRQSVSPLLALTLLGLARPALASEAPSIVRVYVAGPPAAVAGSRDAIQDVCSRSAVLVVVQDAAGADEALLATQHAPALAEAYIDLRPGSPTRVVVVDGQTREDLERRLLPGGSSLEISIETVAHVVCSAVESSLAARAAPPPLRSPPDSGAHAPNRRSSLTSPWGARLSLFGAVQNFGAGVQGGAGGALGVSHGSGAWHAGLLLSVADYAAADVESGPALASFGVVGARLLPMLELRLSPTVTGFAAIGGGGDWTRVSAGRPPPGGSAQPASATLDAIGAAMLGAELHVGYGLSALFAVDADVDLTRHRYVTASSPGNLVVFEPARVRPMALAGFSVAFGGSGGVAPSAQRGRR